MDDAGPRSAQDADQTLETGADQSEHSAPSRTRHAGDFTVTVVDGDFRHESSSSPSPALERGSFEAETVPGDTSVFVQVRAEDPNALVHVMRVEGPDGEVLFAKDPDGRIVTNANAPLSLLNFGGTGITLPMHPLSSLKEGHYRVDFEAKDSTLAQVQAFYKRESDADTQGVQLRIVVSATSPAPSDWPAFQDALTTHWNRVLAPHELGIFGVEMVPPPAGMLSVLPLDPPFHIGEMCRQAAQAFPSQMNLTVIVVDALGNADADAEKQGLSASSPGLLADPLAFGSCVIVRYSSSWREMSMVALHELGHHAMLPHTSGPSGRPHDSYGDTPECDISRDVNGDYTLSPLECGREGGADNLLFWHYQSEWPDGEWLSQEQAIMLRRYPLFRRGDLGQ